MSLQCWYVLMLCGLLSVMARAESLAFEYTLDNRYQTSAGVYDAQGRLVRTLWSNRTGEAGPYQASWDGLDDDGAPAPIGQEYEIKLLAHNLDYRWEGVIGNTSEDQTSPGRLEYPYFMQDFEVVGRRAYAIDTGEGKVMRVRWHDLDHPNAGSQPHPGIEIMRGTYLTHLASDGARVFVARLPDKTENVAPDEHAAFVVALDADLSREELFPGFGPLCTVGRTPYTSINSCYSDGRESYRYASGIDVTRAHVLANATFNSVTGMAVQGTGNLLFVAHGRLGDAPAVDPRTGLDAQDELHVLNKLTGELLQSVPMSDAGELAVCRSTTDPRANTLLWVLQTDGGGETVLSRFSISAINGELAAVPELIINGFSKPLNVSVSPDCNTVVVADGGMAQQFKAFDTTTGAAVWTMGQPGGYRSNGPTVTTDKFSFSQRLEVNNRVDELAFLGFEDDGSFWASDTGLSRVLKFDAARSYQDQMAWIPINYSARVDLNDPTRVFREYKEFSVDYSKPIAESWTLVQDYAHGLSSTPSVEPFGFASGFSSVATLSNGRTYAIVDVQKSPNRVAVVEIVQGQPLRFTARSMSTIAHLTADGHLRSVRYASGGGDSIEICEQTLHGFDANHDPEWDPLVVVARVPRRATDPSITGNGLLSRVVGEFRDRTLVMFDPEKNTATERFRLAAARRGETSQWLWRASKNSGEFDIEHPDGRFDNGTQQQYAANGVDVLGEQAVYSYHGEFWRNAQAHQFLHFHESGLFVGQFGTPNLLEIPGPVPGKGGNALSIQMVAVAGNTYLWHSNEHTHAGVNRWRLDGLEWMHFRRGRGVLGHLTPVQLTADAVPGRAQFPAPQALQSVDIGNQGVFTSDGNHRLLTWQHPDEAVTGFEVQKLVPSYLGRRFSTIATLNADTVSYVDSHPTLGQDDLYRVRALFAQGTSEWSLPHRTLPEAAPIGGFTEDFNDAKWNNFEWFYGVFYCALSGAGPDGAYCGRQVDGDEKIFRRRIIAPTSGTVDDNLTLFLRAPTELRTALTPDALAMEFNQALGRPLGAPPVYYRFSFGLRQASAAVPRDAQTIARADIAVELAPVSLVRPFLRSGGRVSFPLAAIAESTDQRGFRRISTIVAAVPNGRVGAGLGGFHFSEVGESTNKVSVNFTITAHGLLPGSGLEYWLDDILVERLAGAVPEFFELAGDNDPAGIVDPALAALIRRMFGLEASEPLVRLHLRLLAYLDLRGQGVTSLEGLQAATELRAIDLTGSTVSDLSPLDGLVNLSLRLGANGSAVTPTQVPTLPLLALGLVGLAVLATARYRLRLRVSRVSHPG